jgi:DNA-binding transcriptional LysR family regulator
MKNGFRNWTDVQVLLAVTREGSTLAASRKLGMAQPTVARRIEALEHELRLLLFERDTRGYRPTAAARALLAHAEAIEAAASDFAAAAARLTSARPIRVTAFGRNFSPHVMEIFNAYSERHPDCRFEFLPGVKVLDLMAGEADIAIRLLRTPPDPNLICRKVSTAQFALYGSEAYAGRHGLPRSAAELSGHRFVTYQRDDVQRSSYDWVTEHVAPDQIANVFAEVELMHTAIKSGRGLGIVNVRLAEQEGGYVRCFDPIPELEMEHLILVAPETHRRPEVRDFLRFFVPRYVALFP